MARFALVSIQFSYNHIKTKLGFSVILEWNHSVSMVYPTNYIYEIIELFD